MIAILKNKYSYWNMHVLTIVGPFFYIANPYIQNK
jgi:hypothetical protein